MRILRPKLPYILVGVLAGGFLVLVAIIGVLLVQQRQLSAQVHQIQSALTPTSTRPAQATPSTTIAPSATPTLTPVPYVPPAMPTPTPTPTYSGPPLTASPTGEVVMNCVSPGANTTIVTITNHTNNTLAWTYTSPGGPNSSTYGWGIGTSGDSNPLKPNQSTQIWLTFNIACCGVPVPNASLMMTWYPSSSPGGGPSGPAFGTTDAICKAGQ